MSHIKDARKAQAAGLDEKNLYASRVRVYPKAVHGMARTFKWSVLAVCLTLYYGAAWLRWDRGPGHPNQALLLDLPNRRFYLFSIEFWPQDIYYLTGALILGAVSLFLITSLVGRVWCAYACPQTVWTDLFMFVERRIEGDRNERMKRDAGPTTFDKVCRKLAKHVVWLGVAFWTGGAWIMYFADAPTVTREFWGGTAPAPVYIFTFIFSAFAYVFAGWAREQVCTYMCPWPRFQASMLDEESITVTYQAWRGEPRGHGRRDPAAAKKLGDCVDCNACVNVCPTGIDIRDGSQLECINCSLCVDACNEIMVRTGQPKWLITWDSLARQKAKAGGKFERFHFLRPRTLIYIGAMIAAISVMGIALARRTHVDLAIQHDRAPLFVTTRDGALRNAYTIKIANKTLENAEFTLDISGLTDATMEVPEVTRGRVARLTLPVEADSIGTYRVLVYGRPDHLKDGSQDLEFVLRSLRTGETSRYQSVFMGPTGNPARP